jgi:hypothetical protein
MPGLHGFVGYRMAADAATCFAMSASGLPGNRVEA